MLRGDGHLYVYDTTIDEAVTDINANDVRAELEAVLMATAAAAGATFVR